MSKRLVGGIVDCKYKTSSWHLVALGQQCNTGEKTTIILYTYIERHYWTPDKKKRKVLSTWYMCLIRSILAQSTSFGVSLTYQPGFEKEKTNIM